MASSPLSLPNLNGTSPTKTSLLRYCTNEQQRIHPARCVRNRLHPSCRPVFITEILLHMRTDDQTNPTDADVSRPVAAPPHEPEWAQDSLQTLVDGLDDGLLLLDESGRVLALNHSLATLFGADIGTLVGRPWHELCSQRLPVFPAAWVIETLAAGQVRQQYQPILDPTGSLRQMEVRAVALIQPQRPGISIIVRFVDMAAQSQVEARRIEQERLAANEQLAATVAHQLNTPLQAIESCLYMAARCNDLERQQHLALAHAEVLRIGLLLRQLLERHDPDYQAALAASYAPHACDGDGSGIALPGQRRRFPQQPCTNHHPVVPQQQP